MSGLDRRRSSSPRIAGPRAGSRRPVWVARTFPARHGSRRRAFEDERHRFEAQRRRQLRQPVPAASHRIQAHQPVGHGWVDFTMPYLRDYLREHVALDAQHGVAAWRRLLQWSSVTEGPLFIVDNSEGGGTGSTTCRVVGLAKQHRHRHRSLLDLDGHWATRRTTWRSSPTGATTTTSRRVGAGPLDRCRVWQLGLTGRSRPARPVR